MLHRNVMEFVRKYSGNAGGAYPKRRGEGSLGHILPLSLRVSVHEKNLLMFYNNEIN